MGLYMPHIYKRRKKYTPGGISCKDFETRPRRKDSSLTDKEIEQSQRRLEEILGVREREKSGNQ